MIMIFLFFLVICPNEGFLLVLVEKYHGSLIALSNLFEISALWSTVWLAYYMCVAVFISDHSFLAKPVACFFYIAKVCFWSAVNIDNWTVCMKIWSERSSQSFKSNCWRWIKITTNSRPFLERFGIEIASLSKLSPSLFTDHDNKPLELRC